MSVCPGFIQIRIELKIWRFIFLADIACEDIFINGGVDTTINPSS